jgi:hypothetical protein
MDEGRYQIKFDFHSANQNIIKFAAVSEEFSFLQADDKTIKNSGRV